MQRRTFLSRTTRAGLGLGLLGTTGLLSCGSGDATMADDADSEEMAKDNAAAETPAFSSSSL